MASTDDLPEGSINEYYTDERARDDIAEAFQDGTATTFTNNDSGNTMQVDLDVASESEAIEASVSSKGVTPQRMGQYHAKSLDSVTLEDYTYTTETPDVAGEFQVSQGVIYIKAKSTDTTKLNSMFYNGIDVEIGTGVGGTINAHEIQSNGNYKITLTTPYRGSNSFSGTYDILFRGLATKHVDDAIAGTKITDLSDVGGSAPSNGEGLVWNSTTNQYEPNTVSAETPSVGTVFGISGNPGAGQIIKRNADNDAWIFAEDATGSDSTGLTAEQVADLMGNTVMTDGTGIDIVYSDTANSGSGSITVSIENGGVDTAQIAADAVDGTKIANDAVGADQMATSAVVRATLASSVYATEAEAKSKTNSAAVMTPERTHEVVADEAPTVYARDEFTGINLIGTGTLDADKELKLTASNVFQLYLTPASDDLIGPYLKLGTVIKLAESGGTQRVNSSITDIETLAKAGANFRYQLTVADDGNLAINTVLSNMTMTLQSAGYDNYAREAIKEVHDAIKSTGQINAGDISNNEFELNIKSGVLPQVASSEEVAAGMNNTKIVTPLTLRSEQKSVDDGTTFTGFTYVASNPSTGNFTRTGTNANGYTFTFHSSNANVTSLDEIMGPNSAFDIKRDNSNSFIGEAAYVWRIGNTFSIKAKPNGTETGSLTTGTFNLRVEGALYTELRDQNFVVASDLSGGTDISVSSPADDGTITIAYTGSGGGSGITTISAATDTNISSPAQHQVLSWDGTDWINTTADAANLGITGSIPDGSLISVSSGGTFSVISSLSDGFVDVNTLNGLSSTSSGFIKADGDGTFSVSAGGGSGIDPSDSTESITDTDRIAIKHGDDWGANTIEDFRIDVQPFHLTKEIFSGYRYRSAALTAKGQVRKYTHADGSLRIQVASLDADAKAFSQIFTPGAKFRYYYSNALFELLVLANVAVASNTINLVECTTAVSAQVGNDPSTDQQISIGFEGKALLYSELAQSVGDTDRDKMLGMSRKAITDAIPEFADDGEARAGTSTSLIISPATLETVLEEEVHVASYPGFQRQATLNAGGSNLAVGGWHINSDGDEFYARGHNQAEAEGMVRQFQVDKSCILEKTGARFDFDFEDVTTITPTVGSTLIPIIKVDILDHRVEPANPNTSGDFTIRVMPAQNKEVLEHAPAGSIPNIALEHDYAASIKGLSANGGPNIGSLLGTTAQGGLSSVTPTTTGLLPVPHPDQNSTPSNTGEITFTPQSADSQFRCDLNSTFGWNNNNSGNRKINYFLLRKIGNNTETVVFRAENVINEATQGAELSAYSFYIDAPNTTSQVRYRWAMMRNYSSQPNTSIYPNVQSAGFMEIPNKD